VVPLGLADALWKLRCRPMCCPSSKRKPLLARTDWLIEHRLEACSVGRSPGWPLVQAIL